MSALRSLYRTTWVVAAAASAVAAGVLLPGSHGIEDAAATGAAIHISGTGGQGVNLRAAATSGSARLGWVPEGAAPDIQCFVHGQRVGTVDVWFRVSYRGASGYYASYYDDAHYSSNADLTARYGVPMCGQSAPAAAAPAPAVPPSAPVDSAAARAVGWARGTVGRAQAAPADAALYADSDWAPGPRGEWSGDCLKLVATAWTRATGDRNRVPRGVGNAINVYHYYAARQRVSTQGTPPAGALVFYGLSSMGHVALSTGAGTVVTTHGLDGAGQANSETDYRALGSYLGWAMP